MESQAIGSSFDDILKDEGILEKVETAAIKKVAIFQAETQVGEKPAQPKPGGPLSVRR